MESLSHETVRLKLENVLKPWRKQKWFIPKVGGPPNLWRSSAEWDGCFACPSPSCGSESALSEFAIVDVPDEVGHPGFALGRQASPGPVIGV